jgi:hypothetical protein
MASSFDILIGGSPASDFDTNIVELEVEENVDMPSAFRLTLPVALTSSGDFDTVSDPRLGPLSNIAVTAKAADDQVHCLIDGYVLVVEWGKTSTETVQCALSTAPGVHHKLVGAILNKTDLRSMHRYTPHHTSECYFRAPTASF